MPGFGVCLDCIPQDGCPVIYHEYCNYDFKFYAKSFMFRAHVKYYLGSLRIDGESYGHLRFVPYETKNNARRKGISEIICSSSCICFSVRE